MSSPLNFASFLQQLLDGLPGWTGQVEQRLLDAATAALGDAWQSAVQRGQVNELVSALRGRPRQLGEAFARSLAERMREELAEPSPLNHDRPLHLMEDAGTLSLMEEHDVEVGIEQVRIERQIDQAGEWTQRELRGLCGNLPGRPMHLPGSAYPLTPEVCAEAYGRALKALHFTAPQQLTAMRLAGPLLAKQLAEVFEQHLQQLRDAGVSPAPLVIRSAGGAGLAWGEAAAAAPGPQALPQDGNAAATQSRQLGELVQILSRQSHSGPAMDTVWQRLHSPMTRLAPAQLAALQQEDHPFWRLLDRIAGLSEVQSADDPQMQRLADQLDPMLVQLEEAGDTLSNASFDSALAQLDSLPAPMPAVSPQALESALDHEARRREMEPAVRGQLVEQLRALMLPPVLKQFLLGPWVQVLSRVLARDGTQAPATLHAMNLVPDLLAAASQQRRGQPLAPMERQRLLDAAEDGMDAAGLPGHMVNGYLADLAAVLSGVAATHSSPEAPDSPTLVITPAMLAAAKGELLPEPEPPPPGFDPTNMRGWSDTAREEWHGHAELATVPMAMAEEAEAARLAREAWLQGLKAGQLCRLMLQGRWTTALLTWRSDNGQFFMFKSRHAAGSHTLTYRALDRLRREGLATHIEPGQMLARARRAMAN